MSKLVVVHHAHHPDEGESGIYRLVFAEAVEHVVTHHEPNPEFDPEADAGESNPQMLEREERLVEHLNHQEVVWDAGDARWEGRSPEDIAAEQRKIVRRAITRQAKAAERAAAKARKSVKQLGGLGTEL